MSTKILTGYTGERHITPYDDAKVFKSIFGDRDCILATGGQLEAEFTDNNTFVIEDGAFSIQGHVCVTTGETLTVSTVASGNKRIDLVVARYTHDSSTNIDAVSIVVLEGTPTSGNSPLTPTYSTGTIADGQNRDMILYKLEHEGSTHIITKVPVTRSFLADYVLEGKIEKKTSNSGEGAGMTATREDTGVSTFFGVGEGGYNHGVYSYYHDKWLMYLDQSGVARIPASDLRVGGHSSGIGSIVQIAPTANRSCASNTWYSLCSMVLSAGVWVIEAGARWSGNGVGSRIANVASTSGDSAHNICIGPSGAGVPTSVRFSVIVTPTTNTRYYLNVNQTSGATLTCPAAGNGTGNFLRAVRIL